MGRSRVHGSKVLQTANSMEGVFASTCQANAHRSAEAHPRFDSSGGKRAAKLAAAGTRSQAAGRQR